MKIFQVMRLSCLENSHGQRSLAGYSPWSCKELDMTEQLSIYAFKFSLNCIPYV